MKKTVLTIGVLLSFCVCQAQKDIRYYNQKIDSLVQVYSVPKYISVNDLDFSLEKAILSTNDKDQLIKKIEKLYKQETYINLYSLASVMLRDMFYNKSEKAIRQKITEISLEYYYYPLTSKFDSRDVSDYSPKAKKLLLEVLQKYNNKKKDKQLFNLYMIREKEYYASDDHIRDDLRKQRKHPGKYILRT
jgi:hypothetical protein